MAALVLGVVQSPGEPGPAHLDEVGALVAEAAAQGAQLVLLPELFSSPFHFDAAVWQWATPRGGRVEQFLRSAARTAGIYLGGSYLEARGGDFFNTFALASPAGDIVGRVGKAHPCSLERAVFAPAPGPKVIETELGRIGVGICYDNTRRAEVDRLLAGDPDLWLMPMSAPLPPGGAWMRKRQDAFVHVLRDSPRATAALCGLPVAMANKAGPWRSAMPGWLPAVQSHFAGLSRIVDGDAREVASLGDAPGVAVATVRLDPAGKRLRLPPAYDRYRPWIVPPSLEYRSFALFEWWAGRRYRRDDARPRLALERSRTDVQS